MTKFDDLWTELSTDATERSGQRIDEIIASETARLANFTVSAPGIHADLSKNLISSNDLNKLIALSERQEITKKIHAMFAGDIINTTETRAVLHTLLRYRPQSFPDKDKIAAVEESLAQIKSLTEQATTVP